MPKKNKRPKTLSKTLKKAKKLYLSAPNQRSATTHMHDGTVCPRAAVLLVLDGQTGIPNESNCAFDFAQRYFGHEGLANSGLFTVISKILHNAARETSGVSEIDQIGCNPALAKKAFDYAIKHAEAAEKQYEDRILALTAATTHGGN